MEIKLNCSPCSFKPVFFNKKLLKWKTVRFNHPLHQRCKWQHDESWGQNEQKSHSYRHLASCKKAKATCKERDCPLSSANSYILNNSTRPSALSHVSRYSEILFQCFFPPMFIVVSFQCICLSVFFSQGFQNKSCYDAKHMLCLRSLCFLSLYDMSSSLREREREVVRYIFLVFGPVVGVADRSHAH